MPHRGAWAGSRFGTVARQGLRPRARHPSSYRSRTPRRRCRKPGDPGPTHRAKRRGGRGAAGPPPDGAAGQPLPGRSPGATGPPRFAPSAAAAVLLPGALSLTLGSGASAGTLRGGHLHRRRRDDHRRRLDILQSLQLLTPAGRQHRPADQEEGHIRTDRGGRGVETLGTERFAPEFLQGAQGPRRVAAAATQSAAGRNALPQFEPDTPRRLADGLEERPRRRQHEVRVIGRRPAPGHLEAHGLSRVDPAHRQAVAEIDRLQHGRDRVVAVRAPAVNPQTQVDLGGTRQADLCFHQALPGSQAPGRKPSGTSGAGSAPLSSLAGLF